MKQQKMKNIILILMFVVCIYLSSRVWLQLPDLSGLFSMFQKQGETPVYEADIWAVVRPEKYIIRLRDEYTVINAENGTDLWSEALIQIERCFRSEEIYDIKVSEGKPKLDEYIEMKLSSSVPMEIFMRKMQAENQNVMISDILSVIVNKEEQNSIYIYDGESTFQITSSAADNSNIIKILENFNFKTITIHKFYKQKNI